MGNGENMSRNRTRDARYERTGVYLETATKKPKHMFVCLGDRLASLLDSKDAPALLDVGGAAGAFAGYMAGRFPSLAVTCLDADKALVERAAAEHEGITFVQGDANHLKGIKDDTFDAVTMTGTMSIFDDFRPSLGQCLRVCRPGGKVIVTGQFNEYPVDALIQWRYAGDDGHYNRGYNLFSRHSVDMFLKAHSKACAWDFEKFVLPFDLAPQKDPIRTWTQTDAQGNRVFRNGLMEINLQILEIGL